MKRVLVVLVVALVLASYAVSASARSVVVAVSNSPDGPQIYESGSIKGWTVEESDFVDVSSGAVIMGPILPGTPAVTDSSVTLTTTLGRPRISEWIASGAVWQPEIVLFRSANQEGGAGKVFDLIYPWPKKPPSPRRIFHYSGSR